MRAHAALYAYCRRRRQTNLQSVIEAKDAVVDVVLSGGGAHQLEQLAVVERVGGVLANLDAARHEDEDGVGLDGRLHVGGLDGVLDGPQTAELADNVLRALELLALKGHHRAGLLLCLFVVVCCLFVVRISKRASKQGKEHIN